MKNEKQKKENLWKIVVVSNWAFVFVNNEKVKFVWIFIWAAFKNINLLSQKCKDYDNSYLRWMHIFMQKTLFISTKRKIWFSISHNFVNVWICVVTQNCMEMNDIECSWLHKKFFWLILFIIWLKSSSQNHKIFGYHLLESNNFQYPYI